MATRRIIRRLVVQAKLADGREVPRRFKTSSDKPEAWKKVHAEAKAWAESRGAEILSTKRTQETKWRALVPVPGGGFRERLRDSMNEAEAYEKAEKVARSVGVDLSLAQEPLSEVVARWRDGVGVDWEAKTAEQADSFLRAHILPEFGDWPVGKIRHSDVQAWVGRLKREGAGRTYQVTLADGSSAPRVFKTHAEAEAWAIRKPGRSLGSSEPKGLSLRTVRGVVGLLSRVLDSSVRDGALHRNPCDGVKFGKESAVAGNAKRWLERAEVWSMAEAMPDRYRALFLTGCLAGLRFEELAGLRRDRILAPVDLVGYSRIKIDQAVVSVNGRLITKGPKSKKSAREVPIPSILAEMLEDHCERFGVGSSDPVFTSPTGAPLRHGNFSRRVLHPVSHKVLGAAIGTHDMRRTFGALKLAEGVSPKVIQKWMGHSSLRVTMDIYAEVLSSVEAEAMALVEDANSGGDSEAGWFRFGPENQGEVSAAL